jgi:hypothetical protein
MKTKDVIGCKNVTICHYVQKNVQFLTLFFEKLCSQKFMTLKRILEHYAHKVLFFVDFQAAA